ncbi:MAG: hypothetical protein DME33_02365, partial [Verrucomicrobia bacterium]
RASRSRQARTLALQSWDACAPVDCVQPFNFIWERLMNRSVFSLLFSVIVFGSVIAASTPSAFTQSQALNGQIEGTVSDQNKAAVPNAVITVTNIESGATRTVTTDESGVYRFPLLPLGTYRITTEASNFKKLVHEGVTLTTGQTATVDLNLPTGDIQEVVTVSSDTSVADAGKTNLGRVMNTREVQNLPLIPRNPYNFALLQANVTGRPSRGFAFPNVNANGYLRRVNYQLDGNTNTEGDRGSQRFMFISDTYISEIQLVTNGFAAEFGNTPGLIMNVVTPSGTNELHGAVSYRFRRPRFYSRPFFYASSEDIPNNKADNFTATVGLNLPTGDIQEVVTVSSDTSVADAGKTNLGRVMNTREVQNLPLIPRNPYNFALLQANVTGRPSRGFAFPNVNANGYLRRVNYQLDGNTNTEGDRGSQRFMFISDTYISEIQLVTNGFAAEFGNTPGLIMNVVTPSGTNELHGAVSYRFRRPRFYSRPFFYASSEDIPNNKADNFTATVGGSIIKDRWHFFFGYEWQYRDDQVAAVRLLTITPENRAQLIAAGLSPSIFPLAIPSLETGPFYIFRTDAQLNENNRLSARFNHSDLQSKNFIPGGLNTLERSFDAFSVDYGLAVQLASYTPQTLNEFRFQYARRTSSGSSLGRRNEFSGSGASIVTTGVANFGAPEGIDTIFPTWTITQFQDNLTRTNGTHVVKFGGGFSLYDQAVRAAVFSRYTFSSIANYIAARNGTNPRSYTNYQETFGDPEIGYKATFWNFFAQDDWKLTRHLKINYGLRYDRYQIPKADATSPFSASQKFNVDKNNFAPRVGVVYALREGDHPTIIRASAGIYYDAPLLAMYQRTLQNNGNARFF